MNQATRQAVEECMERLRRAADQMSETAQLSPQRGSSGRRQRRQGALFPDCPPDPSLSPIGGSFSPLAQPLSPQRVPPETPDLLTGSPPREFEGAPAMEPYRVVPGLPRGIRPSAEEDQRRKAASQRNLEQLRRTGRLPEHLWLPEVPDRTPDWAKGVPATPPGCPPEWPRENFFAEPFATEPPWGHSPEQSAVQQSPVQQSPVNEILHTIDSLVHEVVAVVEDLNTSGGSLGIMEDMDDSLTGYQDTSGGSLGIMEDMDDSLTGYQPSGVDTTGSSIGYLPTMNEGFFEDQDSSLGILSEHEMSGAQQGGDEAFSQFFVGRDRQICPPQQQQRFSPPITAREDSSLGIIYDDRLSGLQGSQEDFSEFLTVPGRQICPGQEQQTFSPPLLTSRLQPGQYATSTPIPSPGTSPEQRTTTISETIITSASFTHAEIPYGFGRAGPSWAVSQTDYEAIPRRPGYHWRPQYRLDSTSTSPSSPSTQSSSPSPRPSPQPSPQRTPSPKQPLLQPSYVDPQVIRQRPVCPEDSRKGGSQEKRYRYAYSPYRPPPERRPKRQPTRVPKRFCPSRARDDSWSEEDSWSTIRSDSSSSPSPESSPEPQPATFHATLPPQPVTYHATLTPQPATYDATLTPQPLTYDTAQPPEPATPDATQPRCPSPTEPRPVSSVSFTSIQETPTERKTVTFSEHVSTRLIPPREGLSDEQKMCRYGSTYYTPKTASCYRPPPRFPEPEPPKRRERPVYTEPWQGPLGPWVYGSARPPPRTAAGTIKSDLTPAPRPQLRSVSAERPATTSTTTRSLSAPGSSRIPRQPSAQVARSTTPVETRQLRPPAVTASQDTTPTGIPRARGMRLPTPRQTPGPGTSQLRQPTRIPQTGSAGTSQIPTGLSASTRTGMRPYGRTGAPSPAVGTRQLCPPTATAVQQPTPTGIPRQRGLRPPTPRQTPPGPPAAQTSRIPNPRGTVRPRTPNQNFPDPTRSERSPAEYFDIERTIVDVDNRIRRLELEVFSPEEASPPAIAPEISPEIRDRFMDSFGRIRQSIGRLHTLIDRRRAEAECEDVPAGYSP